MSKKLLNSKQTAVRSQAGVGTQTEATLTIEEDVLPSPSEIAAYNNINPEIVNHILEVAKREQEFRHAQEQGKLKLLEHEAKRTFRTNIWGMFFAMVALVVMMGLAGLALWLDRPWFAGALCFTSAISIVSLFVNKDEVSNKKK